VQLVHHLAAAFRELNVKNTYYDDVNVGGTRIMLDAAVKAGVPRFIYCSTCGVHGNVQNPPCPENGPIKPADYYQRTKYEAEPIVLRYHAEGKIQGVILRPAAIYGPGDPERFQMIFKRVARGSFPMFGNGKTLYHPLYIDNLVDAFIKAMTPGKGDGQAYLIADREYLSIEDLVLKTAKALDVNVKIRHYPILPVIVAGHICEKLCTPVGITPPIFPRRVDWYRQNRAFDISKACKDLGYNPAIGIDEGLRRTAEWYRNNGYI
jgi:2-alkyl-3-oxoalkanoate reductase